MGSIRAFFCRLLSSRISAGSYRLFGSEVFGFPRIWKVGFSRGLYKGFQKGVRRISTNPTDSLTFGDTCKERYHFLKLKDPNALNP